MGKFGPHVQLRLEVESMRHEIVQALMVHEEQLTADITSLVNEAIANFDFQKIIRDMAERTITEAIQAAIKKDVTRAAEGAWQEMRDLIMSRLLKAELE